MTMVQTALKNPKQQAARLLSLFVLNPTSMLTTNECK